MFSSITQWFSNLQANPSGTLITLAYTAVCILFSLILHECAHGWVAWKCGDPTAKMLGRLTLNPLKHLDPLGTICMVFLHFGWAKPVPINPRNFRHYRRDYILVSLAGIVANLLLCILSLIVSALFCRVLYNSYLIEYARNNGFQNNLINSNYLLPNAILNGEFQAVIGNVNPGSEWVLYIKRFFLLLARMNLYLAVFNLIPVPPLDGYRFLDMFVFKGKLMIDRRVEQIISIVFMFLLLSGVLNGLINTVYDFLMDKLCIVMGMLV